MREAEVKKHRLKLVEARGGFRLVVDEDWHEH